MPGAEIKRAAPTAPRFTYEEPPVDPTGPTPTEEEVRVMSNRTIRPFLEQMRKGIRNDAEETV